jgi:FkbM family methyltransferase
MAKTQLITIQLHSGMLTFAGFRFQMRVRVATMLAVMKRILHRYYAKLPGSIRGRLRPYYYGTAIKLRFYFKVATFVGKSLLMTSGPASKLGMARCAFDWLRLRSGHQVRPKDVTFQVSTLRITLDPSRHEIYPFWEIWCDDDYERLPQFRACENSVVVDVGGNIGLYTMRQAIRAVRGRVVTFEPGPDTFRRLSANIHANGLSQVTLVNAAVGAEEGTVPFFLHPYSTRGRVSKKDAPGTVDVPCTTLDSALRQYSVDHIDIMKIDTEGHERAVLEGATSILPLTKRLVIEVHRNHAEEKLWVEQFLRPFGFRIVDSDRSLLYMER